MPVKLAARSVPVCPAGSCRDVLLGRSGGAYVQKHAGFSVGLLCVMKFSRWSALCVQAAPAYLRYQTARPAPRWTMASGTPRSGTVIWQLDILSCASDDYDSCSHVQLIWSGFMIMSCPKSVENLQIFDSENWFGNFEKAVLQSLLDYVLNFSFAS